jgi:hypothetical protein
MESPPHFLNNIHKSSNNIANIQYMPMGLPNKKGFAYLEIFVIIVIIGTGGVLTLDMYNSNNKVDGDEQDMRKSKFFVTESKGWK